MYSQYSLVVECWTHHPEAPGSNPTHFWFPWNFFFQNFFNPNVKIRKSTVRSANHNYVDWPLNKTKFLT